MVNSGMRFLISMCSHIGSELNYLNTVYTVMPEQTKMHNFIISTLREIDNNALTSSSLSLYFTIVCMSVGLGFIRE